MSLSSFLVPGGASGMTSFFSIEYMFVFLPIAILLYWLSPQKIRRYVLLFESCAFFWLISGKLIAYLALSAVLIYGFGLWIEKVNAKKKEAIHDLDRDEKKKIKKQFTARLRLVLALAAVIQIGGLLVLKYSAFAAGNINSLLALMNVGVRVGIPKFIMPIGISFFTLQAVSYLVDVYRGKIQADKNFLRVFLWLSFFPQIVEGPICRYSQTAEQLWKAEKIKFDSLTLGLQRIIFGMMKKIVVADRLNPLIENVFNNYNEYHGGVIALAAVCYTIQLYMDFSGSMDAVMGTAQIFGVEMPENFKRPFFSRTISEFWKRWHVTLGEWLKDYIFYPITMSKPMQKLTKSARKKLGNYFGPLLAGSVALFCVWFANGLWHGAAWSYIFFGMYHFTLILTGRILAPLINTVNGKLNVNTKSKPYKAMQIIRSDILVVIGELFFRANGLRAGMKMFGRMVTDFSFGSSARALFTKLGVDCADLLIVGVTVAIVFAVSVLNERGICVRAELKNKNIVLRWAVLLLLCMYIVIFGAYGIGYMPVDPIYANF